MWAAQSQKMKWTPKMSEIHRIDKYKADCAVVRFSRNSILIWDVFSEESNTEEWLHNPIAMSQPPREKVEVK
jgi:hypothetical protein